MLNVSDTSGKDFINESVQSGVRHMRTTFLIIV